MQPRTDGFADRQLAEKWLRRKTPLGLVRRELLRLTMDDVHKGAADFTDREWDLVRPWCRGASGAEEAYATGPW